jgi:hypothetical protein
MLPDGSFPGYPGPIDPRRPLGGVAFPAMPARPVFPQGPTGQPGGAPGPGFGQGATPFGKGAMPFGKGAMPFGKGAMPFGKGATPFGKGATPFGKGATPFGKGATPFGKGAMPWGAAPAMGQAYAPPAAAGGPLAGLQQFGVPVSYTPGGNPMVQANAAQGFQMPPDLPGMPRMPGPPDGFFTGGMAGGGGFFQPIAAVAPFDPANQVQQFQQQYPQ